MATMVSNHTPRVSHLQAPLTCAGPFRKSCELTLGLLRQNEDTLMTILETFLYDPTTDFIGKKVNGHFLAPSPNPNTNPPPKTQTDNPTLQKRTKSTVPDTPEGVLESVRNKVRGLLPGESMPLSVEGHVHELIQHATSPKNLAAMYIGWCSFF